MKTVTIKPAKGKLLRNPFQSFEVIPELGTTVPYNSFWIKRIKHGDAVIVKSSSNKKLQESK